MNNQSLIPVERIEKAILYIRQQKVILDTDIAGLYGVETKVLIQAVKRNFERFPEDFMFQLNKEESVGRGQHRKYLPYAFTEQGVAMLSSVLHSPQAVQVTSKL
jgi:hypothetical protein